MGGGDVLDDVGGDVAWFGAGPETGVVAELEGELVVDARPAEEQDDLVAEALLLHEVDERQRVLFVAVSLGDDLAHEDHVGVESSCSLGELLVLDLGSEVEGLEPFVALESLVAPVALVVQDRVDADGVRVRAGARSHHDDLSSEPRLDAVLDFFAREGLGAKLRDVDLGHVHRVCLLYTSDAADERSSVDLGGRRIIKKFGSLTSFLEEMKKAGFERSYIYRVKKKFKKEGY